MANWNDLKASVAEVIKTNGNQEITGQILQNVLSSIISNLGENATFVGIATPTTNPGTPDGPVFYLASQSGTYSNFSGIILDKSDIYVLSNASDNTWESKAVGLEGHFNTLIYNDISPFVNGDIKEIFINEKSYINNEGKIGGTANNNWFTSIYIPISIAKNWTISHAGYANKSYPNMAFFDKSFNPLGGYKYMSYGSSIGYTDLTVTDELLQSYPTAEYVVYASYDLELSQVSVKNNINEIAERISDCEGSINEINTSLDKNTEKISEIEETISSGLGTEIIGNLFTDVTTESGYYLSNGNPASNTSWSITSFIEVEPGTEYAYNKASGDYSHDYFYDKNQSVISAISYNATNNPVLLLTTPENCKYVRFSLNSANPNTTKAYLCKTSSIQNWLLPKETVIKGNLRVDNILDRNLLYQKKTSNLLDVKSIVRDTFLRGFNNPVSNEQDWSTTEVIQVESNTSYLLFTGANYQKITPEHSFFADKYGRQISEISANEDNIFTTPANCQYVQFSIRNYSDKLVLQKVGEPHYFIPYGFEADYQNIVHSPFLGKKVCIMGDSTTEGGQWMIYVAQNLGMWLYVNSIGGTTVAYDDVKGSDTTSMCTDTRINAIPEDTDIIVFAGGLNDWAQQGIVMGTLEGEHTHDNFYGAYQLMLDKAFARCPNARFVLAELTYRHQGGANSKGATMMDYRNAVRDIAEKYCYPLLPMYKNAGINATNYTQFSSTGDDPVHHNDAGNIRLGSVATAAFLANV